MRKHIVVVLVLFALAACDREKVEVLKSPCAGVDGSPCGPKRPVNDWWQHGAGGQAVMLRTESADRDA